MKIKRVIEIEESDYELSRQRYGDARYNGHQPDYENTAIAQSTPYNPSGDAISREAINSEIEKRYCSKHCVVPSEEPYCPDNCPARFLKNIVKECPTVPQVTVFAENADEKAVADLKAELENVIESRPQGTLTEAEKIICKVYLEDLDKLHTCNEYKLLMSLIDNAQEIKHSLLPLSGTADDAYMRGYEVGKAEGILKTNTRPKGEWTVTKLQHGEDVTCPFCNARPTKSEYGYYLRDNFCHECGADMRAKENKNV